MLHLGSLKSKIFAGIDPVNKIAAANQIFSCLFFIKWLAFPQAVMVTAAAGLFNTYESPHLLGNLNHCNVGNMIYGACVL